jgi:cobalt-zinc-cadmium efflux system outer membrane protein
MTVAVSQAKLIQIPSPWPREEMRRRPYIGLLAVAVSATAALPAWAQAPATDAVVERLLSDVLVRSPEIAQARSALQAEEQRIPQVGALPDPILSLGIQNDGFKSIEIGTMETSFYSIAATQAFPWPGKRGLREQIATLESRRAEARLERVRLSVEGQVRRAYLEFLLARDQLDLLGELQSLWQQAQAAAKARYESAQAPQSDLLRAQLERARLEQRRWVLEAQVANRLAAVNRLRLAALDDPLETSARILDTADPVPQTVEEAARDAMARSPELALARLGVEQTGRRVELAKRDRFPDFSVSAAVMPRGSLEPMWSLGVGVSVPIWIGRKQQKTVEENQARQASDTQGEQAIRQVLLLRVRERVALLEALVKTNRRFRESVLVLSEATRRSTLSQYQVGRLPFASALEALGSYLADRSSYLESVAEAQRIAISQREVSLDSAAVASIAMSAGAVPGAGGQGGGVSAASAAAPGEGAAAGTQRSGMGGM